MLVKRSNHINQNIDFVQCRNITLQTVQKPEKYFFFCFSTLVKNDNFRISSKNHLIKEATLRRKTDCLP